MSNIPEICIKLNTKKLDGALDSIVWNTNFRAILVEIADKIINEFPKMEGGSKFLIKLQGLPKTEKLFDVDNTSTRVTGLKDFLRYFGIQLANTISKKGIQSQYLKDQNTSQFVGSKLTFRHNIFNVDGSKKSEVRIFFTKVRER